jgi:hypothetical protein
MDPIRKPCKDHAHRDPVTHVCVLWDPTSALHISILLRTVSNAKPKRQHGNATQLTANFAHTAALFARLMNCEIGVKIVDIMSLSLDAPTQTVPTAFVLTATHFRTSKSVVGQGDQTINTLCYAITAPCRKSVFRARFRPDSNLGNLKIGPLAGLSLQEVCKIQPEFNPEHRFPARKHYCATEGKSNNCLCRQSRCASKEAKPRPAVRCGGKRHRIKSLSASSKQSMCIAGQQRTVPQKSHSCFSKRI